MCVCCVCAHTHAHVDVRTWVRARAHPRTYAHMCAHELQILPAPLMANSDNVPLNLYAMLCSDSVDADPATNMTNVFESIVSLTRNKAPMCKC